MTVSYGAPQQMSVWTKTAGEVGGLVEGIGDAAYWGSAGEDPPSVLAFRTDRRAVRILVMTAGARTIDRQKLVELANTIAGRLRE